MAAKKKQVPSAANELREPIWSVVSWEKCEASGLTYEAAQDKIAELASRNFSGLCIITDEAAGRIVPPPKEPGFEVRLSDSPFVPIRRRGSRRSSSRTTKRK